MIPEQLKNQKFILTNGKIPIEKDWHNSKNYSWDNPTLLKHITYFKSYGILTGYNNLIVIDFDNAEIQEEIINKNVLPETFTVKTAGKGLLHYYYYVDKPESFKCMDKDKNTILDVQGKGKQVIAPNTIINNKKYEVIKDKPIETTTIDYLKEILKPYNYINIEEKIIQIIRNRPVDDVIDKIKERFTPKDILEMGGVDTSINPTRCPFHSSKGGKCLGFLPTYFHCFHCDMAGDVLTLYEKLFNKTFLETKRELAEKGGIKIKEKTPGQGFSKEAENSFDVLKLCQDFFNVQPYRYDEKNLWWIFDKNKSCWVLTDETQIIIAIKNAFKIQGITTSTMQTNLINGFKIIGREFKPIIPDNNLILFGDKIYDLKTQNFIESDYHYFFTNSIVYLPSEYEDTPVMDKLITEWVGTEYKQTLYEILAYCCFRDYPMHLLFIFIGSGRNGKGRFMALIRKFLGLNNVVSSELELIMENRFETAKLYKKLVCLLGETNFDTIRNTSMIKKLCGQDLIGMEFKNKNPFDSENYAKIIIASNSLPSSEDTSDGWYRRIFRIDFPNEFPEGKNVLESIPEGEYNNLAKKICRILPKLLENGKFSNQGTIEQRKKRYIEASNPLINFIEGQCERDSEAFIRYNDLFNVYSRYLNEKKMRIVNRKEFKDSLILEGLDPYKTTIEIKGKYENGLFIRGMKFKYFDDLNLRETKHEEPNISTWNM